MCTPQHPQVGAQPLHSASLRGWVTVAPLSPTGGTVSASPTPEPPPKARLFKGALWHPVEFQRSEDGAGRPPLRQPHHLQQHQPCVGQDRPPRGAHRQHPATPYRCSDPDDKHEGQWEGGFTLHIALSPLPGLPSWCGWGHGGVQGRDCPPPSLSFLEVPAFLIKQRLPLLRKGPQNPALPHGKRGKGHGDPPKALRDPIPTRSPRPGGCRGGFSGAGSGARRGSERHRQEAPLGQRRGAMERARTGRC